jgi:hypothetical protein
MSAATGEDERTGLGASRPTIRSDRWVNPAAGERRSVWLGIGGNHKGVTPATEPSKYRDALERSGNPKDTREIMMERTSGLAACGLAAAGSVWS